MWHCGLICYLPTTGWFKLDLRPPGQWPRATHHGSMTDSKWSNENFTELLLLIEIHPRYVVRTDG